MDYEKDIEEDAISLLLDHDDMFKEAIKEGTDFDRNDIGGLDMAFFENITDRAYSPEDSVFILENCENEETDSGLWEGLDDWREQLSARAAYSYGNDVWFKTEELYNKLKERYEEMIDIYQYWIDTVNSIECEEDIPTQDAFEKVYSELIEAFGNSKIPFNEEQFLDAITTEELPEDFLVDVVWKEFKQEHTVKPIDPESYEALDILQEWVDMGSKAGWWGDYPLGGSYIDARCGAGYSMPSVKEFVDYDHEVAHKLPHLAGKYREDIVKELERLKERIKAK